MVVVGATSNPSAIDPALRRPGRLDRELLVNVPTRMDRIAILTMQLGRLSLTQGRAGASLSALATRIAQQTAGYTGADLHALVLEIAMTAHSEPDSPEGEDMGSIAIEQVHIDAALQVVRPSLARGAAVEVAPGRFIWVYLYTYGNYCKHEAFVALAYYRYTHTHTHTHTHKQINTTCHTVAWSELGGIAAIRTALQHAVEWPLIHTTAFERLGLSAPRGVLLYGPPGCSKTSLARAVATSCACPLIPLSAAALYSMYVGEGEALLRARFQQARQTAPSIVFLDELDALAGMLLFGLLWLRCMKRVTCRCLS